MSLVLCLVPWLYVGCLKPGAMVVCPLVYARYLGLPIPLYVELQFHYYLGVCGSLYTLLCVSLTLSIPSTLTLLSWCVWRLVHIVVCFFNTINT